MQLLLPDLVLVHGAEQMLPHSLLVRLLLGISCVRNGQDELCVCMWERKRE